MIYLCLLLDCTVTVLLLYVVEKGVVFSKCVLFCNGLQPNISICSSKISINVKKLSQINTILTVHFYEIEKLLLGRSF